MVGRVNGTSVGRMSRPIQSTAYQSTRERARISDHKIQLMRIEGLAIRIFGCVQLVMENRSPDLTKLWSDEDNLVGRPKFYSPV